MFAKLPPLSVLFGLRAWKSVLSVLIASLLMHYVFHQSPFFACIGAVVAVERTLPQSIRMAVIRNVGTIVGGVVGIAISSFTESIVWVSIGLLPVIYINIYLGKKESIVPGAIVYFAVSYLNDMGHAWSYGLTRIFGTLVGTLVALAVNALLFPPKEEPESLSA